MLTEIDRPNALRRCVEMALAGIHREFPCQMPVMQDEPVLFQRPRDWMPAFYGCFDWHSAVHSHWLLVHWLAHNDSQQPLALRIRDALSLTLTRENLQAEYRFLNDPLRTSFERPYGLAWLLQLAAELRGWSDPQSQEWHQWIEPLEQLAATRIREWLPKLHAPVRTGEHSQTAFALGLISDWAQARNDNPMIDVIRQTAIRFYGRDQNLPIHWEPSAYDFLSPALASADLMRRVIDSHQFSDWFSVALPAFPDDISLRPVAMPKDVADGKLAHYVGLNFSRAWMLEGIAAGLPADDPRRPQLQQLALEHLQEGVPMLDCQEYSVTHWVGSFATYALAECGLRIRASTSA